MNTNAVPLPSVWNRLSVKPKFHLYIQLKAKSETWTPACTVGLRQTSVKTQTGNEPAQGLVLFTLVFSRIWHDLISNHCLHMADISDQKSANCRHTTCWKPGVINLAFSLDRQVEFELYKQETFPPKKLKIFMFWNIVNDISSCWHGTTMAERSCTTEINLMIIMK